MKIRKNKTKIMLFTSILVLSMFISVQAPSISWTKHTIVNDMPDCINAAVADIDGDGYNDVVVVGRGESPDGYVAWYKNNSDYSSWTEYIIYEIDGNRMVHLDDFDGDGDTDVCVSNYVNDRIDVYECPSDPTSVPWTRHAVTTSGVDPGYVMWIYDFDGDGDTDVYGASPYQSNFNWWRNDGSFSFTQYTVASVSGARGCAIGDFDNDGDMDVTGASGSGSYPINWYENDGTPTSSWTGHSIGSGTVSEPTGQYAMDVDGDGDTDLVVKSLANSALYWYENSNNGASWSAHSIGGLGTTYQIWGGDLDDDGDNDVGCSNLSGGGWYWMENTAGDGSSWTKRWIDDGSDTRDVYFSDYDDDGVLDVFGCDLGTNSCFWFESNLVSSTPSGSNSDNETPQFISINGQINGSFIYDSTPIISWNVTSNTSQYWLRIDNNADFSSPVVNLTNINQYTFSSNCAIDSNRVNFTIPISYQLVVGTYYMEVYAYQR